MDPSRWHNLGYLFWAYTLFWLLLAGYLLTLANRVRRLGREMEEIRAARRDAGASRDA